jgi:hypothetical protein
MQRLWGCRLWRLRRDCECQPSAPPFGPILCGEVLLAATTLAGDDPAVRSPRDICLRSHPAEQQPARPRAPRRRAVTMEGRRTPPLLLLTQHARYTRSLVVRRNRDTPKDEITKLTQLALSHENSFGRSCGHCSRTKLRRNTRAGGRRRSFWLATLQVRRMVARLDHLGAREEV